MSRDPRLDAALRYAPDHREGAPAALSRAILEQARAAVRLTPAAPARRWWQQLADRVAPPRWAAGFATAALVVVVGTLWRLTPESAWTPTPPPPPEAAPARQVAPPARSTPPASAAAVSPPPVMEKAAPPAPKAAAAEAPRQRLPAHLAQDVAPAPPRIEVVPPVVPPAPVVAAQAAPAALPPVARAAPAAPMPPAATAGVSPTETVTDAPALQRSAGAARLAEDALAPEPPSLQALGAASAPSTPALQWLQRVREAAAGRWQPAAVQSLPEEAVWRFRGSAAGPSAATVQRTGNTLWWQEADGTMWTAPLDPATAAALPPPAP